MRAYKACALGAISLALLMAAGCGSIGVKPWERDLMSRRDMQFDGESLDARLDDHVYFSKEASSGGRSFGGGGCGCN
jgi:Domain of unknown function (DUF4266)